jgi:hypothetical protein
MTWTSTPEWARASAARAGAASVAVTTKPHSRNALASRPEPQPASSTRPPGGSMAANAVCWSRMAASTLRAKKVSAFAS